MAREDQSGQNRTGRRWSRKHLLAGLLVVVMVALVANTLGTLYEEGDRVCRAMNHSVAATQGRRMPCTIRSYPTGVNDPAVLLAAGPASWETTLAHYRFDEDGGLRGFSLDMGGDGTLDDELDCSTVGKMLVPVTNYRMWIAHSVISDLSGGSEPGMRRALADASSMGLRTTVEEVGSETSRSLNILEARTHNDAGQLIRRVTHQPGGSSLSMSSYDYDRSGDLVSVRQVQVWASRTITRRTDYTYACWESGEE